MEDIPLQLGSQREFGQVRAFLDRSGYTPEAAAERIGFPRLDQLNQPALCDYASRERNLSVRDALSALVRLFLCGQRMQEKDAAAVIPRDALAALETQGLLERHGPDLFSPVLFFPAHGLYLASDRYVNPDGSPVARKDFVYLPLQNNTTDFMKSMPDSSCETFLDLGGGCGIAGLWAAKTFARQAWSTDVNARATHFAEFNRRLNGIDNLTVATGDLYSAAGEQRFERIACHPPYAATPRGGYIYADGGEDGEALLRRVIEGAPDRLLPGGVLVCFQVASDREGELLEQRARRWLGDRHAEFDIATVVEQYVEPLSYAAEAVTGGGSPAGAMIEWRERFARHRIERLVYGALYLRRHARSGTLPFTSRRMRSAETTTAAVESMMQWESAAAQPDRDAVLLASRPRPSEAAELGVAHRFREGALQPMEYTLRARFPFDATMQCRAWVARLFSRCDGKRTGVELLAEAKVDREPFCHALAALISGGFVEIEPGSKL